MGKTKSSVYLVTKTDGTYVEVRNRKDLSAALEKIGKKKWVNIYRAVPMAFAERTTVTLVAVKPEEDKPTDVG